MGKKVIYECFNALTGKWEKRIITEGEWLAEMSELDNEKEVLDAELEVINKIIEQHLNDPMNENKLEESRD